YQKRRKSKLSRFWKTIAFLPRVCASAIAVTGCRGPANTGLNCVLSYSRTPVRDKTKIALMRRWQFHPESLILEADGLPSQTSLHEPDFGRDIALRCPR